LFPATNEGSSYNLVILVWGDRKFTAGYIFMIVGAPSLGAQGNLW